MKWLILLFIAVPAAELALLLTAGSHLGVVPTIAIIFITGIGGAYLAKRQGFRAITEFRQRLAMGDAPGPAIIDGLLIFLGGILLLMPGFITDITGLLLLFSWPRHFIRPLIIRLIYRKMKKGTLIVR
ncbi:membrane protein FxsA [Sporosarcina sp. NCCP-2716]|uniref:FxsA family protein n=1 Tax=Sporosarcina sp. NCCP-2716 TaxID=2943679 RepID=UPI0020425E94|nr:FxsA family protein [Sporosarcina sp. NCCP-2716]GKV69582.1 membrane protein FxsA [Sporosarcina sp. NCCP-2716]